MRNLDPALAAAFEAGVLIPAILAQLTFASGTYYAWTGYGPLHWNGNTFLGVGTLGSFGGVTESTDVRADGTTVGLSGIDPALYSDCMQDIQLGAPATIWLALLSQGAIIGAPYKIFEGTVDQPVIEPGTEEIAITLSLENLITNLQRATCSRYTAADQRVLYPTDSAFNGVEQLADQALIWGT